MSTKNGGFCIIRLKKGLVLHLDLAELFKYGRRLLAYPKGKGDEHLSLYLEVANKDSLPDGWSRTANLTIILINQKNSTMSIKQEAEHQFKKGDSGWRFASFFPLSKLHDKNGGYLVDGTCVIEAEVSVTDVFPVSTDEPSDYSVHSDQSIDSMSDLDDAESISIKDESFLKSISRESTSSIEDVASSAKKRFDKLISLPLDDLVDPENETAMIETLSILGDNLSLFSDDLAKQIMQLKANFPITLQKWRDLVQVKENCQHSLSTSEITKNLLEDSVETEKGIKTQLEELKIREEELKVQLEALQNKSQRLVKERLDVSKQTQQIYALAEEQAGKIGGKEQELSVANKNLEDLKSNWSSMKSFFVEG
ncbi:MATH domain and coiled-coil domain-containing protein At3g58270-like isoform X2 [Olea europaea var. sylvestris]|uniref:MATH domain and coiled-coil domain-containing protein At3g58270-like isoform X2 n=1 Tax=Olea europaea var. sylvestris TaxID=158386 RepID=UPI000C1D5BBF|nr:MATH domain and coiled-coil domain-containing protein At3g58270-like isoform X2 [Olea europaea var. sylvestris]